MEACLNSSITENLSFNLRYSNNANSAHAICGGLEWRFLRFYKFSVSAGLEYSYNSYVSKIDSALSNFGLIELPLHIQYDISERFSLKGSFIFRTDDSNGLRLGAFYKF